VSVLQREARIEFAHYKQEMGVPAELRQFLLASYHDLPNVLFTGSFLLGSLTGYLPLVWMALGLILNATTVTFAQAFIAFLALKFPSIKNSAYMSADSPACTVGFQRIRALEDKNEVTGERIVMPSHWLSASAFFAFFSIYNSGQLMSRDAAANTDPQKINNRKAFSISALVIGIVFMGLIFMRGYTGCETKWGGIVGVVWGIVMAYGFWHILDACGTGRVPDILQVVGSLAPEGADTTTPVICSAMTADADAQVQTQTQNTPAA
jgi:type IV secretory pathway VirB2 component (pilin)